jgi:hypothetical protein
MAAKPAGSEGPRHATYRLLGNAALELGSRRLQRCSLCGLVRDLARLLGNPALDVDQLLVLALLDVPAARSDWL